MTSHIREQPRAALGRARRTNRLYVTPVEAAAALVTLTALVIISVYYFNSLKPEQQRVLDARKRLEEQEKTLVEQRIGGREKPDGAGDTSGQAKESLAEFKEKWLKPLGQGRIALIDDINALTAKAGVQLTSGIEMQSGSQSESSAEKRERQKKTEDLLNIYPKLDVQFTVFGQYHNLRSFVKELEGNKQFLVIQEITLTSVDESKNGGVGRGARRGGATSGIALTINANCYFHP